MRIAIVTGPFIPCPPAPSGGVEKVWSALAGRFAAQGYDVTLLARRASEPSDDFLHDGVRQLRIPGPRRAGTLPIDLLKDLAWSRRASRRLPPADVIVTNSFFLPLALRGRRGDGTRLVVHMARFPKRQTRLYLHCDRIQVPSEAVRRAVVEQCPRAEPLLQVVPYPVDTSVFHPGSAEARDPNVILYAGRVHPEKGVLLLAQSLARLNRPRVRLRIAGPVEIERGGGGPEYLAQVRAAAGATPIELAGDLADPQDLAREMRQAAIFCYPSLADRGETFGIAPLEALASGVPTIVSSLPVFGEHIQPDRTGLVFEHRAPDAVEQLAAVLSRLLDDEPLRDRLGRAGRDHAERFSYDRVASRHLSDFETLLST